MGWQTENFQNFDIRAGLPKVLELEDGYDDAFLISPMRSSANMGYSYAAKSLFNGAEARVFHVDTSFDIRIKQTGGYGGNPVTFITKEASRKLKPVNPQFVRLRMQFKAYSRTIPIVITGVQNRFHCAIYNYKSSSSDGSSKIIMFLGRVSR